MEGVSRARRLYMLLAASKGAVDLAFAGGCADSTTMNQTGQAPGRRGSKTCSRSPRLPVADLSCLPPRCFSAFLHPAFICHPSSQRCHGDSHGHSHSHENQSFSVAIEVAHLSFNAVVRTTGQLTRNIRGSCLVMNRALASIPTIAIRQI